MPHPTASSLGPDTVDLTSLLDGIEDGMLGVDLAGCTTFVNPAAARILGASPQDLLGRPHPADPSVVQSAISQNRVRRVPDGLFERATGTFVPVSYTATPLHREDRVIGAVVAFRPRQVVDMTENASLIAVERRFEGAISSIPQQVWTSFPDGQLDWVSQQITDYFGVPAEAVLGSGWRDVLHPDDVGRVQALWTESLETLEPYQALFRLRRRDGAYRWHLARARVVLDSSGIPSHWIGTNTDIHERHQAASAREELINIVSHDLRNPLNAILATTRLLTKVGATADLSAHLDRVQRSASAMAQLLDDLLDVTRIDAGNLVVRPIDTSVQALFDEVEALTSPLADKAQIHLVFEPADFHGRLDAARMTQTLTNLIANSLRYTPHDGTIRVRAWQEPGSTRIEVADTGRGIAPEHLERVFDRFWLHDSKDGVGLGLPIAKGILAGHGGRIWVEPSDVGATFRMDLPHA